MKDALKKIISMILVLAVSVTFCIPAFAANIHSENKDNLVPSDFLTDTIAMPLRTSFNSC